MSAELHTPVVSIVHRVEAVDHLVTSGSVCELLGGIDRSTLWRWQQDRGFPAPHCQIGGRNYWRFADVRDWIAAQAEKKAA